MLGERVVSTIGLVLFQLIEMVRQQIPNVKTVYDERLSFETSVAKFRSDNDLDANYSDFYPMFAFNRSVLRYADKGMQRRSGSASAYKDLAPSFPGQSDTYKTVQAEMDVNFLFLTKSMTDEEAFEIEYLSQMGMTSQKTLTVDLREDLNLDLNYFIQYGDLSEKTIESDQTYFKGVTGTMVVRGFYPVFMARSKHIIEVIGNIYGSTPTTILQPSGELLKTVTFHT